jgi:hypothetical protein
LPLFIFLTNPQDLSIPFLILPVILLFIIIYVTVYFGILKRFARAKHISRTRMYVISAVIALVPVLIIVLASINQFTLRDVILASIIVIFISWYLLKVDFLKT